MSTAPLLWPVKPLWVERCDLVNVNLLPTQHWSTVVHG